MNDGKEYSRYRTLPFPINILFFICALASIYLAIEHFFSISLFKHTFAEMEYYYLLISLLLPFVFLFFPATKASASKIPWYDYIVFAISFLPGLYFAFNHKLINLGYWTIKPPLLGYIFAIVLLLLTLESARRVGGTIFLAVCIFLSTLPLYASYLPKFIRGPQLDFQALVALVTFDTEGLMGIPMQVIGGVLIGFLIFAGILIGTGAGDFFLNMAMALGGHTRGGIAKVAVIGSAFFGSLSGCIVSNIVGTGSITIPGMKKAGFPNHYAAAVEACASTGGVLMPPVMGAVAFIAASMIQVPYATVMVAAIIPSLLFYFGLLVHVDIYSARNGLKGMHKKDLPKIRDVFKKGWYFLFVLAFLVWGLLYMRWETSTPFYAAALLILIVVATFKNSGFNLGMLVATIKRIGELLVETMGIILPLGIVCGGILITGIAPAFSAGILTMSRGIPFLALILGFIACYALGMAGLTTAAYIFLALSLAPALVSAGFQVLGVHLFIIYCAMLAAITPPVAAGAFIAANLAGANPMKTAVTSMKLGVAIYFIPFIFVYEPALILQGSIVDIVFHVSTALAGIFLIAASLDGYIPIKHIGSLKLFERILIGSIGMLLVAPSTICFYLGFVFLIIFSVYLFLKTKQKLVDVL